MWTPLPSRRHPRWQEGVFITALAVMAAGLLFLPQDWESPLSSLAVLGTAVMGFGALVWLGWSGLRARLEASFGPALLGLLAVGCVSALAASDVALSLNTLAVTLALWIVFFLSFLFSRSLRFVKISLMWLLGAAFFLSLFGIYQYAGGLSETYTRLFANQAPQGLVERELAGRLLSGRAFSLFVYPNAFAGFLALLIPPALSLLLSSRRARDYWTWGTVLTLLSAALFATQSLGGWAATGIGLGWFYLSYRESSTAARRSPWVRVLGWSGLVLMAGGLAFMLFQREGGAAWDGLRLRWEHWRAGLRMLWEHPFLGVGPGLFGEVYAKSLGTGEPFARFAHNALIQAAAETGLAGLAALAYFLVKFFRVIRGGLRAWRRDPQHVLILGLAAGVLAGALHALVDVDFSFLKNAAMFMLLLGMLAGLCARRWHHPLSLRLETVGAVEQAGRGQVLAAPKPAVWPVAALSVVLIFSLWRGARSLPVEIGSIVAIGLIWMAWRVQALGTAFKPPAPLPLRWSFGFLWVWGILSAAFSPNPSAAVPGLTLALAGFLVFWMAWELALKSFAIIGPLIASALGLGVAALFDVWGRFEFRVGLNWPNPNLLAAFLAMGLIAAAGWAADAAVGGKRRAWLPGAAAGIIGLGLLATGSFGGLLNAALGAGVLGLWHARRRSRIWLGLAGGVAVMGLLVWWVPLATGQRMHQMADFADLAYERIHMAGAALQMTGDFPLTGVGPGNFGARFEQYSFPNVRGLARYGKVAYFAHNELLQMLAVLGIPGLVVLLFLLGEVGKRLLGIWRSDPPPGSRSWPSSMPIIASAVLCGAAGQALVDFNWHLPSLWLWGMAWLGIALARPETQPVAAAPHKPRLVRALAQPAALILVLVGLAALVAAARPFVSDYYLNLGKAHQYKKNLKAAVEDYQRALSVHAFSAEAYDRLGQIQADFYATSGAEHWFSLGEWAYLKATGLNGLDPYVHRHLGQLYYYKASHLFGAEQQRYYIRAMDQYREGIRKAPHQAFLFFELGNVLRNAGQLPQAAEIWHRALELEPYYAAAWSNLGVVQEMQGNTLAAEASYRQALFLRGLVPAVTSKYEIELLSLNWAVVHYNLAQLLERQGRWAEARAHYAEALQLEPGNSLARRRWQALRRITR